METLTVEEVNEGQEIVVYEAETLPDGYDKHIGKRLIIDGFNGDQEVRCTAIETGDEIILIDNEFVLPEQNTQFLKQKRKLNI